MRPAIERFMEKIAPEPNSGCWLWDACTNPQGYGQFTSGGRGTATTAHRFAYEYFKGPVPPGLYIDHLCRVRCCANPAHLEAVTNQENIRRGEAGLKTGAKNRAKTHCKQGHPFSGSNLYVTSNGGRACKACKIESQRRARALTGPAAKKRRRK